MATLSSLWDGLNDHLIATFYVVEPTDSYEWTRSLSDETVVRAPLTDVTLEIDLNWQSPFEQAGPESAAPSLMAMLQSGQLQPVVDAVAGSRGDISRESKEYLNQFEGRTGITKLNSTQIFNGMQPARINATVVFRAWRDALTEVEEPFDQLMQWALPQELSRDGSIIARLANSAKSDGSDHVGMLMPSLSPLKIGMTYKGRSFLPLVIESISQPLSSPINADGHFIEIRSQLTLCTLTAIDKNDWASTKTLII